MNNEQIILNKVNGNINELKNIICKQGLISQELKDFINKLIDDLEKEYFKDFYVQPIKIITKFEL